MARLLGVSTSGYYAWLARAPSKRACSDARLLARIRTLHASSRGTYGAPRLHAQLAREGVHVGRKRVACLMRLAGLRGASWRRWPHTTRSRAGARRAPDLIRRHFSAAAPNVLWVADATYIPAGEGFLYLAVVLDVFSRRIVGWAMSNHLYTELMLARWTWRCSSGVMRASSCIRIRAPNIPRWPSGGAAATPACNRRWGRPATRTTTRCANRSSAHSRRSCCRANPSRPMNRPGGACSPSWRAGTTCAACTAVSAIVRRLNSKI